jgi:hypothetical protein
MVTFEADHVTPGEASADQLPADGVGLPGATKLKYRNLLAAEAGVPGVVSGDVSDTAHDSREGRESAAKSMLNSSVTNAAA